MCPPPPLLPPPPPHPPHLPPPPYRADEDEVEFTTRVSVYSSFGMRSSYTQPSPYRAVAQARRRGLPQAGGSSTSVAQSCAQTTPIADGAGPSCGAQTSLSETRMHQKVNALQEA